MAAHECTVVAVGRVMTLRQGNPAAMYLDIRESRQMGDMPLPVMVCGRAKGYYTKARHARKHCSIPTAPGHKLYPHMICKFLSIKCHFVFKTIHSKIRDLLVPLIKDPCPYGGELHFDTARTNAMEGSLEHPRKPGILYSKPSALVTQRWVLYYAIHQPHPEATRSTVVVIPKVMIEARQGTQRQRSGPPSPKLGMSHRTQAHPPIIAAARDRFCPILQDRLQGAWPPTVMVSEPSIFPPAAKARIYVPCNSRTQSRKIDRRSFGGSRGPLARAKQGCRFGATSLDSWACYITHDIQPSRINAASIVSL
ncbi:hypothetical protein BJ170DRAFT_592280 [Xylariales sp. AK1849]|nr:hypothetical protein BJ170DRAFT_592280 [Xylariales sp. AK1849]